MIAIFGVREPIFLMSDITQLYHGFSKTKDLRVGQNGFIFCDMWTRILLICASLLLAPKAFATGGFSCAVDDENLTFDALSATGRGMGSPFINLKAVVKLKLKSTPNDFAELDLKNALVHSWMDHPELRLHFYLERQGKTPHGTFELIILTTAVGDDVTYAGEYRMRMFYTEPPADPTLGAYLKATGKITCEVE